MPDSDPSRLSDASDALGELFRDAQRDVPGDAELERLRARLPPVFSGGAPAAHRPGLSKLSRAGLGALALGAAVVVGYLATRSPATTTPAGASSVQTAPPAVSAPEPSASVAEPAATEPSAAAPAAEPAPSASSAVAAAAKPARDKIPEATLLEQARRALDRNPAQALALTRRHQALYPNGVLTQEREVIAIEALRRLGASSKASERANGFERDYPDSAHRRTVEKGLGQ